MRRSILTLTVLLIAVLPLGVSAQSADEQRLAVPLSDPGKPVKLHVSLLSGRIEVTAYQGDEVIVVARPRPENSRGHEEKTADGMRRIPNTSMGLTVEEEDNQVEVGSEWISRGVDLEIRVPKRTSAYLSTVNGGDLVVRGLQGEMELQNTNGGITAVDISGSVVADTTNGPVRVSFVDVEPDRDMSFTSFNGSVDLTFPADLHAEFRINAGQGDILTDFEVEQMPIAPKVDRQSDGGRYRVRVEKEVQLKIGGGGPTFHAGTFNGNVYIRKAVR